MPIGQSGLASSAVFASYAFYKREAHHFGGRRKKEKKDEKVEIRALIDGCLCFCIYVFIGEAHVNLSSRGLCFVSVDMEMCTFSVICYT